MPDEPSLVVVDKSSLRLWGTARSGHLVHLAGGTGAWWSECFRRIEAQSRGAWRFYLDEPRAVVAFSCTPGLSDRALARLDELVEKANREAVRDAVHRESGTADRVRGN